MRYDKEMRQNTESLVSSILGGLIVSFYLGEISILEFIGVAILSGIVVIACLEAFRKFLQHD